VLASQARQVHSHIYICVLVSQARQVDSHIYMCISVASQAKWTVIYICVLVSQARQVDSHIYIYIYVSVTNQANGQSYIYIYVLVSQGRQVDSHIHIYVCVSVASQASRQSYIYICVCVSGISFHEFLNGLWNCSDSEEFYCFSFYHFNALIYILTAICTTVVFYPSGISAVCTNGFTVL
jgi:hypothetical protein